MAIAIEQKDDTAIYTQPRWKEKVGGLQELGMGGQILGHVYLLISFTQRQSKISGILE